jgi:hypothetical protein
MFAPTGDLITPRIFHTETVLQNGEVLIAGGSGTGSSAARIREALTIREPTTAQYS